MSKFDSYKCDVCGKLREKDTNRWWNVSGGAPPQGFLSVMHFESVDNADRHACGEDCALQLVARWLATGSFDMPKVVNE